MTTVIYEAIKALIFISFLAFMGNGFSVKKMAEKAFKAKEGMSSYKKYSRLLTGHGLDR